MDVGRRQSSIKKGSIVVAGSVWDDRMKRDHVTGGVKVKLNADQDEEEHEQDEMSRERAAPRSKKAPVPVRRKKWSQQSENGNSIASPNQIFEKASRSSSVDADQCIVSPSAESGSKKSSPVSLRKTRSEITKSLVLVGGDALNESSTVNSPRLRKVKSTPSKAASVGSGQAKAARIAVIEDENSGKKSVRLVPEKMSWGEAASENDELQLEVSSSKFLGMAGLPSVENGNVEIPTETSKVNGLDDYCQEKLITSTSCNVLEGRAETNQYNDEEDHESDEDEDEKEESDSEEIEIEKMKHDLKEDVPNKILNKVIHEGADNCNVDSKISQVPKEKAAALIVKQTPRRTYVKRSAFYSDLNKSNANSIKPLTNSAKPSPNFATPKANFIEPTSSFPKSAPATRSHEDQRHPTSRDRLQSLADLVMWRDVSRSAFVFGIGTFVIISSSYTTDLNISFISVMSYMGLIYLALRFLCRSVLNRGDIHVDSDYYIVGEEEASWVLKLVLPYFNEFLSSLRALFSGDPAMTMKLALVLFVLARCGSSITIWKMAKLGFIGVFTVPKIVSTYSFQLKTHCIFWVTRFKDAWDSCAHKKVVAGIIFTLIWNLCSLVARIWALFMLAVAFRYYQQSMVVDEEWEESDAAVETLAEEGRRVGASESIKEKKAA